MEPIKTYQNIPNQKELAKRLGIANSYLSMLLSGQRKSPKMLKKLEKLISQFLNAA